MVLLRLRRCRRRGWSRGSWPCRLFSKSRGETVFPNDEADQSKFPHGRDAVARSICLTTGSLRRQEPPSRIHQSDCI